MKVSLYPFQDYPEILNTNTKRIVVTTSIVAAMRPNTKLSGLYPLFQHSLEIKYATVKEVAIYMVSNEKPDIYR